MTSPAARFEQLLKGATPILALAPMQDVTHLEFWNLLSHYGEPDLYVTEYFRVHSVSRLTRSILRSITENPTGRLIIAQLIGNDIQGLVRTARDLQHYPIAAVDLNLGCPVHIVCRKAAGGGLLRDPQRLDAILGALRDVVKTSFTVKTRLGYESLEEWERLLPIFAKHSLDALMVHGRLVKQMYSGEVHYDSIALAAKTMPCPVLANGDICSANKAQRVLRQTGAKGVMLGRGAIRNPWLFSQIRQHLGGARMFVPTGRDVLEYLRKLHAAVSTPGMRDHAAVQRLKKYLNFIGAGIEPTGQFLHQVRRTSTSIELFHVCEHFLEHSQPMLLEPFNRTPHALAATAKLEAKMP